MIFAQDGDDCIVIASMDGAPQLPQWYLNLQAHPAAEIQVKGEHRAVIARTATAAEKPRLWQLMVDAWPSYDTYQSRTNGEIPVVVLSPQPH